MDCQWLVTLKGVLACDVCLLVLLFVFLCFAGFFGEAGGGLCVVCHLGHLLASWWNFGGGAMVSSLHCGGPWGSMLAAAPHLELHLDTVGSFCTPLGSIWFHLDPLGLHFGALLAPWARALDPLGHFGVKGLKQVRKNMEKGTPNRQNFKDILSFRRNVPFPCEVIWTRQASQIHTL